MKTKILRFSRWWFIYPEEPVNMEVFILELTRSSEINEAHKKLSDFIGYKVEGDGYISPGFNSKEDAERAAEYFEPIPLFD